MGDSFSSENSERTFSSVRLIYSADPLSPDAKWLEHVDRCTRLVMQVKEDQLLAGIDPQIQQELFEMEAVGFLPYEDEEDIDEEE
jgi:hypothetical protein